MPAEQPVVVLTLNGEGALEGREVVYCGALLRLICLRKGMTSGAASVGVVLELPDGRAALAQTSVKQLVEVVEGIAAVFGRDGCDLVEL